MLQQKARPLLIVSILSAFSAGATIAAADADRPARAIPAAARDVPRGGTAAAAASEGLIVRPRSVAGFAKQGLAAANAEARRRAAVERLDPLLVRRIEAADLFVIQPPAGIDPTELATELRISGDYDIIDPDVTVHAIATPNDPDFALQWHHQKIESELAWDIGTGGPSMVIAVCDTGVDLTHNDLDDHLVSGYNAPDDLPQSQGGDVTGVTDHGSQVAGAAAAAGDNGIGVCGVGWDFSIMPIRVTNFGNTAQLSDILAGVMWAAENGAQIINVSFSGVQHASVEAVGEAVRDLGANLIYSAGNDGLTQTFDHEHIFIVGATDEVDDLAEFSNRGSATDIVAPGVNIHTTRRFNQYGAVDGTSFAAPLASGVLGLVRSINPSLSPFEAEAVVILTVDDLGETGDDNTFGHGRLNAAAAAMLAHDALTVNLAPFAFDDRGVALNGDESVIDVLANDIELNNDDPAIASFDAATTGGGGVALSIGTGPGGRDELIYTPPAGFEGVDSFTYTIEDTTGLEDTATVRLDAARTPAFAARMDYDLGSSLNNKPTGIIAIEVNGDPFLDLVVCTNAPDGVQVLLNQGDGTYSVQPGIVATGGQPTDISAADFNGDDRLDLAVSLQEGDAVAVLLHDGGSGFMLASTHPTGDEPRKVTATAPTTAVDGGGGGDLDLNGDGFADIAVAVRAGNAVVALFGDGAGGFSAAQSIDSVVGAAAITATDIDHDADHDLIVADWGFRNLATYLQSSGGLIVGPQSPVGAAAHDIVAAHLDGDGEIDLVLAMAGLLGETPGIGIMRSGAGGGGSFTAMELLTAGDNTVGVDAADLDDDGDADVIGVNQLSQNLTIRLNRGDGTFLDLGMDLEVLFGPVAVVAADLNDDSRIDLAVANRASGQVSVYLNQTDPTSAAAPVVDIAMVFGTLIGGDAAAVASSDDVYLHAGSQFGFSALEPNIVEILLGADGSTIAGSAALDLGIESRINNPGGAATIKLRNWQTQMLETVHTYALPQQDALETIQSVDATNRIRSSDGRIELGIRHAVVATFSAQGFESWFDMVLIEGE